MICFLCCRLGQGCRIFCFFCRLGRGRRLVIFLYLGVAYWSYLRNTIKVCMCLITHTFFVKLNTSLV